MSQEAKWYKSDLSATLDMREMLKSGWLIQTMTMMCTSGSTGMAMDFKMCVVYYKIAT